MPGTSEPVLNCSKRESLSRIKSPDPFSEQNIQPPKPFVPSLLGQVKWASKETLATFL